MISDAAFNLILAEEVSDKRTYEAKMMGFDWPGLQSGPTVGIGFDCGYNTVASIHAAWDGIISPAAVSQLCRAAGRQGSAAGIWTRANRNAVSIPWTSAVKQFRERTLPKWEDTTRAALPNCNKLSPDSFGALVSVTFNRGPSYSREGSRFAEMRAIRKAMTSEDFAAIPNYLRAMARLWPTMRGLQLRRNHEADLFLAGLAVHA